MTQSAREPRRRFTGTVTNTVTGAAQAVDQTLAAPVTGVTSILDGSPVSIALGSLSGLLGILGTR